MHTFVTEALFRPIQLFFQEPIIFTIAMMIAVAMSLIYIFTEALHPVYESMGFTASQASLIFMALGWGSVLVLSLAFWIATSSTSDDVMVILSSQKIS